MKKRFSFVIVGILHRLKRFFVLGPRDPTARGFGFGWRLGLGYPFLIVAAACGFGAVALAAGLAPKLSRIVLFIPYAVAVTLFGVGLSLALFDPRDICKWQLQEFWT